MFRLLNFRKLLILSMVLWFFYVTVMTIAIARAYPTTQERCLSGFEDLKVTREDDDGTIYYEDPNGVVIVYHPEGYIETKAGIRLCPGNPPYRPGAYEVVLVLTSDCSMVEIDNLDGGWSIVADEKGYIVLHYGQSLFVPADGGITDPLRYKVIAIPCY